MAVCQSDRGGERAAAIYLLFITAELNDVGPREWLANVLRRIADLPRPACTNAYPGTGAKSRRTPPPPPGLYPPRPWPDGYDISDG